ncbi:hypothetical protein CGRA01v4_09041 [Colletotrichum graminicola]|nr:hypothetical protein CGRA01v4_09041 [Colletotrichum graminicola]
MTPYVGCAATRRLSRTAVASCRSSPFFFSPSSGGRQSLLLPLLFAARLTFGIASGPESIPRWDGALPRDGRKSFKSGLLR